jgi:cysteinyl-tRNA synthetase
MISDLLERWSPDSLRLYLARHHYRQAWSHDPAGLEQAEQLASRLVAAVTATGGDADALDPTAAAEQFAAALDNDLDTPAALTVVAALTEDIQTAVQAGRHVTAAQARLRQMTRVFGLRLEANALEPRVTAGWSRHLLDFAEGASDDL